MVVPWAGVFWGDIAGIPTYGIPTCMGKVLDNATFQPKPGALFAAAVRWCPCVLMVIFVIVEGLLDAMGSKASYGAGVGIWESMWILAKSSCDEKFL